MATPHYKPRGDTLQLPLFRLCIKPLPRAEWRHAQPEGKARPPMGKVPPFLSWDKITTFAGMKYPKNGGRDDNLNILNSHRLKEPC